VVSYSPPEQQIPSRKKHTLRNVLLYGGGGAVVLLIGVAIGAASGGTSQAGPRPTVTVTTTITEPGQTVTVTPSPPTPAGPATSIADDASGVYVVGVDIQPGIWHTAGADTNSPDPNCYYALLSSTDTSDIIDNNNVTGPATVTIGSNVKAFDVDGCQAWTKVG